METKYEKSKKVLVDINKVMTTKKLKKFFEDNGFNVFLSKQNNVQCAEIEKWTNGGVDMIIWLNPFNVNEFKSYVNDFDVDEQIDTHRQDSRYKDAFTITESLKDFTDFHNDLKDVVTKLETLKK